MFVSRTMWSTPCSRATSIVRSVEPSSMIEPLDDVEARDLAREVGERRREGLLLVEAGDLDDELHAETVEGRGAGRSAARDRVRRAQAGPPATLRRTLERPRSLDAWLARRSPGRDRASPRSRRAAGARVPWPVLALAGLIVGSTVGFFVYPTYPNYDSLLLAALGPRGAARRRCRASTPTARRPSTRWRSPSARCSRSLGDGADRIMVGADARVVRRPRRRASTGSGAASFTPLVGARRRGAAAARASTSRSSPRAATSTSRTSRSSSGRPRSRPARPRRGTPVFVLLAAAGLLRPEAWLLSGLYFLWCFLAGDAGRSGSSYAALAADRPGRLGAVDLIVTGDPLFSLHHTSGLPRSSAAPRGLSEIPAATVRVPRGARQAAGLLARHRSGSSWRSCSSPRRVGVAARAARGRARDVRARRRSPGCRSSTATCSSRR